MIYEYSCDGCGKTYDIVKSVKDFERQELCPTSSVTMVRGFAPRKIHLFGTQVNEKYYDVSLGQVVNSPKHAVAVAREKGFEPVGNERPEKHLKVQLNDYE